MTEERGSISRIEKHPKKPTFEIFSCRVELKLQSNTTVQAIQDIQDHYKITGRWVESWWV